MKLFYYPIALFLFLSTNISAQAVKMIADDGSIINAVSTSKNDPGISPLACTSGSNLVTFYATNNAQRGHMFDINATNCVTILCFEMNLSVGTSNIDIYTKTGTHVGFESTPGAWTLIGSAANVASAGVNVPTAIPIAINQLIASGATRAFYITRTTAAGPTVAYNNGTAVGNVLAADANITLREGTGKEYPFSTNFIPRQFNGRVFYTVNPPCVLPIELIEFNTIHNGSSVEITWSTASEKNSDYFAIERSKDGVHFEELKQVKAVGNSTTKVKYSEADRSPYTGLSYYRLREYDLDGKVSESFLRSVSPKFVGSPDVSLSPMPAQNNLNMKFTSTEKIDYKMEIFDVTGKLVFSGSLLSDIGYNEKSIDITDLSKGIYFLKMWGNGNEQKVKFAKD
jgi:hypothetical protein